MIAFIVATPRIAPIKAWPKTQKFLAKQNHIIRKGQAAFAATMILFKKSQ